MTFALFFLAVMVAGVVVLAKCDPGGWDDEPGNWWYVGLGMTLGGFIGLLYQVFYNLL